MLLFRNVIQYVTRYVHFCLEALSKSAILVFFCVNLLIALL
jgi:hypothetical protein